MQNWINLVRHPVSWFASDFRYLRQSGRWMGMKAANRPPKVKITKGEWERAEKGKN